MNQFKEVHMSLPKISNKYIFRLIGQDGKVKQHVEAHNIVLRNYYMLDGLYNCLGVVFGSGTTEPSMYDTSMTSELFVGSSAGRTYEILSPTHIKYTTSVVVPADTNHVGKISEFGIFASNSVGDNYTVNKTGRLITKGLMKDAEGNVIFIDKTDTDRLTVDVELHVQFDESDGFFWNTKIYSVFDKYTGIFPRHASYAKPFLKFTPYKPHQSFLMAGLNKGLTGYEEDRIESTYTSTYDSMLFKFGCRLPASSALNGHYLQGITLMPNDNGGSYCPNSCSWYFPSELFPAKQISNITVGVGDGVTSDFEPPLSLWLEDTDELYVDGVLQVRGVDYTIEHNANRQRLHEVTPGAFMKTYSLTNSITPPSNWYSTNTTLIPFTPYLDYDLCFADGTAIVIELDTDGQVGDTINYWVPGTWLIDSTSGSDRAATNVVLNLSSSEDGIDYVPVDSYVYSESTKDTVRNIPATTHKFWKISCDTSSAGSNIDCVYHTLGSSLGYYGEPIKFTNPPADGAKITMNLQLDRPYKNENFVFDIYPEFHFGGD